MSEDFYVGKFIYILAFLALGALAAFIHWTLMRKPTIDVARNKGMKAVRQYLDNPVLALDYLEQHSLTDAELQQKISAGKLEAYTWKHFLFVSEIKK